MKKMKTYVNIISYFYQKTFLQETYEKLGYYAYGYIRINWSMTYSQAPCCIKLNIRIKVIFLSRLKMCFRPNL